MGIAAFVPVLKKKGLLKPVKKNAKKPKAKSR
jgi:hypothetical protein